LRFTIYGLGFGVWGLGFGVWDLGLQFAVWGLGSGVWGLGFGVRFQGFELWDLPDQEQDQTTHHAALVGSEGERSRWGTSAMALHI